MWSVHGLTIFGAYSFMRQFIILHIKFWRIVIGNFGVQQQPAPMSNLNNPFLTNVSIMINFIYKVSKHFHWFKHMMQNEVCSYIFRFLHQPSIPLPLILIKPDGDSWTEQKSSTCSATKGIWRIQYKDNSKS